MAIARVQTSSKAQTLNSGANATCTFGTNVIVGNFIILPIAIYNNGGGNFAVTVTDNLGNTYVESGITKLSGDGKGKLWMYYAPVTTGGACTITIDPTAASNMYITSFGIERSGVNTFDGNSNTGQASSANVSSGAATATNANSLYVGVMSQANSGTTITPPGGSWTEIGEDEGASGEPISIIDLIGSGSQTATWTLGVSRDWHALILCFSPQIASSGKSNMMLMGVS